MALLAISMNAAVSKSILFVGVVKGLIDNSADKKVGVTGNVDIDIGTVAECNSVVIPVPTTAVGASLLFGVTDLDTECSWCGEEESLDGVSVDMQTFTVARRNQKSIYADK